VAVALISLHEGVSSAQEKTAPQEVATEKLQNPAVEASDTLWLWGEVINLSIESNQITVRYLDYDTDNEKEITLTTNEKTSYDNVPSLSNIKPQDTVSVDYYLGPGDKYFAKNISVEKPDELANPPQEETEQKANLPSDTAADVAEPAKP
jgi:hypothetical protein